MIMLAVGRAEDGSSRPGTKDACSQAVLMRETSNSRVTLSLTRTPPVSSATFTGDAVVLAADDQRITRSARRTSGPRTSFESTRRRADEVATNQQRCRVRQPVSPMLTRSGVPDP